MKTNPKKGIVLKWLSKLQTDTRLVFPAQVWSSKEWFDLFKSDNDNYSVCPLFSTIRFFSRILNDIAIDHLINDFKRIQMINGRNSTYVYSLSVKIENSDTQENRKFVICNFAILYITIQNLIFLSLYIYNLKSKSIQI